MDIQKIKQVMQYGIESVLDLIYPNLCMGCERRCNNQKDLFCLSCQSKISPTNHSAYLINPFTEHFNGRINLYTGASLYYYVRGGLVHDILEQIKYRNREDLAYKFGQYYGMILSESPYYQNIDLIIPVPLHKKRLAKRGYNQCSLIAKGMAEALHCSISDQIIMRKINTLTQTDKSRIDRINNMEGVFHILNLTDIHQKNILIVDDVLTTGATLESCALELLKAKPATIRLATIAMGL